MKLPLRLKAFLEVTRENYEQNGHVPTLLVSYPKGQARPNVVQYCLATQEHKRNLELHARTLAYLDAECVLVISESWAVSLESKDCLEAEEAKQIIAEGRSLSEHRDGSRHVFVTYSDSSQDFVALARIENESQLGKWAICEGGCGNFSDLYKKAKLMTVDGKQ
jgi:hypothetical protein